MKSLFALAGLLFMACAVQAAPAPESPVVLVEHTDIAITDSGLDVSSLTTEAAISPLAWDDSWWDCVYPTGGLGHSALKQIHADFNRLFGNPALTAAAKQRYVAICRGTVFGFINNYEFTVKEWPNERNIARNTSPGSGRSCQWVFHNTHMGYIFGRESEFALKSSDSIRRC